jgi:hypothetical protein
VVFCEMEREEEKKALGIREIGTIWGKIDKSN